ncbi:CHAT domain-containing protein [Agromyces sp. SYSU T0242]|uniref:CHAT domain-containing protein n=1 Tax=Agromyces litoreus TaxID=3158561 RepID=UPI00339AEF9B
MPDADYEDLQLRIDRDADGVYRVLAMAPDGRTVRGTFTPPLDDLELDDFVLRVGLARRRGGSGEDRIAEIKELGSALFESLMKDDIGTVYHSARAAAAERLRGLRITLRLSGSPELMRLPWEFLYKRPRFIAQSTRTPVVRSLDVDTALSPRKVELPLRVLGVVSSPTGYDELDADAERANLERALGRLIDAGLVELTWLDRATLGELGRRIAEPDDIHVLHYIGHGAYDSRTESGVLVLETPQGRAHDVSGEDLGAMLQDEESLRLVVLNACEGARTSHIDPFSGVATSLVGFDIPAVIGMQFEITDDAAIAFSDSLYAGLARGLPIDSAMAPARRAIVGAMKESEFATPVLYLRGQDSRLFDIVDAPTEARVQQLQETGVTGARGDANPVGEVPTAVAGRAIPDDAEAPSGSASPSAGAGQVDDPSTMHEEHRAEQASEPPEGAASESRDRSTTPPAAGATPRTKLSIAAAFAASTLLAVSALLLFIGATDESYFYVRDDSLLIPGFLIEAIGLAVLAVHHLVLSGRRGVPIGVLYALAATSSLLVAFLIAGPPASLVAAALIHGAGGVAVLVAGVLLLRSTGRDGPRSVATSTQAVLVMAGGGLVVLAEIVVSGGRGVLGAGPLSSMNFLWPLGGLGIAVGYSIAAVTQIRALRQVPEE